MISNALAAALAKRNIHYGWVVAFTTFLVMLATGAESIRDVIAFPKNNRGTDLMTHSPIEVDFKQLREIYIDADLQLVETAQWVPKLIRRDYDFGLSQVGNGVDDPDQNYPENYACGSRTYMDYCNKEVDALIAAQSAEKDQDRRKRIAWEIDRKLTAEAVRPMIYYMRGGTCWRPEVKNMTLMVNSIFNGWRLEDVWLDR